MQGPIYHPETIKQMLDEMTEAEANELDAYACEPQPGMPPEVTYMVRVCEWLTNWRARRMGGGRG